MRALIADRRGVSPVIGVILMVAITVILASVIGVFVLNLGDSLQPKANAGVSVDNSNVTITSMDTNTKGVKCVNDTGTQIAYGDSVGETLNCNSGNNVVAVGSEGVKNSTIKTDI